MALVSNTRSPTKISTATVTGEVENFSPSSPTIVTMTMDPDEGESEVDDSMSDSSDETPLQNRLIVPNTAVKRRFAMVCGRRSNGSLSNRVEFLTKYKSQKCNRCTELFMDCTISVATKAGISCDECRKGWKNCSKVDLFRRELVMKEMRISEEMFDLLFEGYQRDTAATKPGGKGTPSHGRNVNKEDEEDELDSTTDSEIERVEKLDRKRKDYDDYDDPVEVPVAPKKSRSWKVEVLIPNIREKSGSTKHRHQEDGTQRQLNSRDSSRSLLDKTTDSGNTAIREDNSERGVEGRETNMQRHTEKAVQFGKQKGQAGTRSAVSLTNSAGNLSLSASSTVVSVVPAATLDPPLTSGWLASPTSLNRGQAVAESQRIAGELPGRGLVGIRRQLEDVSSDLRYRRVGMEETLKRFDQVAVWIGKHAEMWEKENR